MIGTLVPLRSGRCATPALAAVDVTAIELLQEGHALTLSGARLDVIQTDLLAQRVQLAAVRADLQARRRSGDVGINAFNATLCAETDMGLAYIDRFLDLVKSCAARVDENGTLSRQAQPA